jgi:hypothetical protein
VFKSRAKSYYLSNVHYVYVVKNKDTISNTVYPNEVNEVLLVSVLDNS